MTSDVARHTVHTLVFRSLKRTHDTFIADHGCLPDNGTFYIQYDLCPVRFVCPVRIFDILPSRQNCRRNEKINQD